MNKAPRKTMLKALAVLAGVALPAAVLVHRPVVASVPALGAGPSHATAQAATAWPKAPGRPRVTFVETIGGAGRPGGGGSFLHRVAQVVAGRADNAMVRPVAVAVRSNGGEEVVYVADPGARALHIVTGRDRRVQSVTKAGPDRLVSPVGVVASDRYVYVSDSALKRVVVFDRRGRFVRTIGDGQLTRPTGLALDERAARLFVADTTAHRIVVFDEDGRVQYQFGVRGRGDGQFNYPTHLGLGPDGSLYVVDALNYRVQRFGPDGRFISAFGRQGDGSGNFASLKGIAVDRRARLYIVDALFDAVQIFDTSGQLLLGFAERGAGPGELWLPAGVCVDGRDRIYVADSYNQRVQVYELLPEADR